MKINVSIVMIVICILMLTGCTSTTSDNNVSTSTSNAQVIETTSDGIEVLKITSNTITYDGEHGSNFGRQSDSIGVIVTLDQDKLITAISLDQVAGKPKSKQYQTSFENAIAGEVIGKSIKDVKIATIGGASNTSVAFNQALDNIRTKVI